MLAQPLGARLAAAVGQLPPSDGSAARAAAEATLEQMGQALEVTAASPSFPVVDVKDRDSFKLSLAQYPNNFASNALALEGSKL